MKTGNKMTREQIEALAENPEAEGERLVQLGKLAAVTMDHSAAYRTASEAFIANPHPDLAIEMVRALDGLEKGAAALMDGWRALTPWGRELWAMQTKARPELSDLATVIPVLEKFVGEQRGYIAEGVRIAGEKAR